MIEEILQWGISSIFSISAISKIRNVHTFQKSLHNFRIPPKLIKPLAISTIIMELAAAIFVAVAPLTRVGSFLTFLLLISFSVLIVKSLLRGDNFPCSCFGETSSRPLSWWDMVRNGVLALATFRLFLYTDRQDYNPYNQVVLVLCVTLVTLSWFAYQFMLKRFRSGPKVDRNESAVIDKPLQATPIKPPIVDDPIFNIESFLSEGKPLVLLFLDFQFLPCQRLLSSSVQRLKTLRETCTILLVGKNEPDNILKIILENNIDIVTQEEHEIADSFNLNGVPSIVMIGLDGAVKLRISGEKAILTALAEKGFPKSYQEKLKFVNKPQRLQLNLSLNEVKLVNQDGHFIALNDLAISTTLLIFWSPRCAACNGLLELLKVRKNQLGDTVRLILVTSTAKGFDGSWLDEIIIDRDFKIGKQFNVKGTPSAIFISINNSETYSAIGKKDILALFNLIPNYSFYFPQLKSNDYALT